ncbi:MAG: tRNA (guanosine(37)-N1)-methyltransferase TrmD [Candidatus Wildermuthbacteria bacterium]|nr:tRNA (guanosine(37)-N1)-methyltransferase TrmD [Candidatus Wildermuthbacteria bacterium]
MIQFDVITIFPELVKAFSQESLLKKAQEKKLLKIGIHNLRDWAKDPHRKVDDKPFGGGLGMVFKVEPLYRAVQSIKGKNKKLKTKVILFTPRGKKFTQQKAEELTKNKRLIFLCGRYEGIDERVAKHIANEELSIGDYVLMGGEVPAMAVIETMARLIPGVVGKPSFLKERRLGAKYGQRQGFLEYPQYTRPEIFEARLRSADGRTSARQWKVPKVLLSGNHKKIEEWKRKRLRIIEK